MVVKEFDMDEYKKFKADMHNVLAIGHKYYIRNHGSNKRNKKIANKVARSRLKRYDKQIFEDFIKNQFWNAVISMVSKSKMVVKLKFYWGVVMKIFYCENCKTCEYNFNSDNLKVTFLNCRDGYGMPLIHVECPYCGNVLSAYMNYQNIDLLDYAKHIIRQYQISEHEGGFLTNKEAIIHEIESFKIKNICEHKYLYIGSNKVGDIIWNDYECIICGGKIVKNSMWDN